MLTQDTINKYVKFAKDFNLYINNAKLNGINVYWRVVETFRNKERQNYLYNQGFSKVKYPDSKHNKRRAFDIAIIIDNKPNYDKNNRFWQAAANIASKHGLIWGGSWTFVDVAHFQN